MSLTMLTEIAARCTVRTPLGETGFADVTVMVVDNVLTVNRDGRTLSWFAAGSWQVSFP